MAMVGLIFIVLLVPSFACPLVPCASGGYGYFSTKPVRYALLAYDMAGKQFSPQEVQGLKRGGCGENTSAACCKQA